MRSRHPHPSTSHTLTVTLLHRNLPTLPHCRGLALLPEVGVVSASHDQTLKVWTLAGECLSELVGHTALVYSAAATPPDGGSLVASGSEDNTARLWHADGACLQVRGRCLRGCGVCVQWGMRMRNGWDGWDARGACTARHPACQRAAPLAGSTVI